MKTKNPNCDKDKCLSENGEVRVLPIGSDGNLILCRACFNHEIAWRHWRNRNNKMFETPNWEDCKVSE